MKHSPAAYPLFAALLLSACSSGGAGGFGPEFAFLVSEAERLSIEAANVAGDPATLPGTGGASYQGIVILANDFDTSTTGVVGTANLTADFDASTISGTGTGFFQTAIDGTTDNPTGSGTVTAGSLDFSAGSIGTTFPLTVSGTVTIDGTSRTINGTADAGFFGPTAGFFAAYGTDLPTLTAYNADIAILAD